MIAALSAGRIPEWSVSDRLRKAREDSGYSQATFAELSGLSRRTVSALETGEKLPGTKEYNLWQMTTGIPRVWLETGCTPSDLNREPTDSGSVIPISSRRPELLELPALIA